MTIGDLKQTSLIELKAVPERAFQSCFEDWKNRQHVTHTEIKNN